MIYFISFSAGRLVIKEKPQWIYYETELGVIYLLTFQFIENVELYPGDYSLIRTERLTKLK